MNYYNEWDAGAAAWLRELIKAGHIPNGYVDERSITEVTPGDLEGFTQCHFFAGIGGWPLALQLAGVPASTRLWTGSPPCQPFSIAGQSRGFDDERHLAPVLLRLVRECRPDYLFGEQVRDAIGKHWLDFVFLNLEDKGYTCGSAVLPACSVGAPHKRDRLFFGSKLVVHSYDECETFSSVADNLRERPHGRRVCKECSGEDSGSEEAFRASQEYRAEGLCSACIVADADNARSQGRERVPECANEQLAGTGGLGGGMAYGNNDRQQSGCRGSGGSQPSEARDDSGRGSSFSATHSPDSFWSDVDWLGCRDGKFRPVEARPQQVVDGVSDSMGCGSDQSFRKALEEVGFPIGTDIPARVARLRGYGNAIVPQVAAEFLKAFFAAEEECEAKNQGRVV